MRSGNPLLLLLSITTLLFGNMSSRSLRAEQPGKASTTSDKIYALLAIHDYRQALEEGERLVAHCPESKRAWHAYIKALAKNGREKALIRAFHTYRSQFLEDPSRELLETIAWGMIEKGMRSPTALVRYYSCLAASMGQDARSVALLRTALCDRNPQLRSEVVNLAAHFRDSSLQEAVYRLLEKERHVSVRVEAIRALGKMNVKAAEEKLLSILSDEHSLAEEKAAAIEALVNLMDAARHREMEQLTLSQRAGLRELACRAVAHTLDSEHIGLIVPLLNDPISFVRGAAAQTLGILKIDTAKGVNVCSLLSPLLEDPDPYAAISAGWAMTLYDQEAGLSHLDRWMGHPNKKVRHFAAGALAKTGKYGMPLMLEKLSDRQDPFVQVNVALGLIALREEPEKTSLILSQFLEETNERVMWSNEGLIRFLAPSKVKFHPLIPHLPDSKDQLTRLELLNIMAVTDDPRAPVAARNFLKKPAWGISGLAASLMLTEGDDQSAEVIEQLLSDSNRNIRAQAALILALWGRGEKAITVLEEAYHDADREMKERILEGIGLVGSTSSIPFLVKTLEEPYQTLRIIAAASLLKCLYH